MKNAFFKSLKSKRGGALIYVVLIATLVTAVSLVIWKASDEGLKTSQRSVQQSKSYYNAKSGVEIAVGHIIKNIESEIEDRTYYGVLGNPQLQTAPIYDLDGNEVHDFRFTIAGAEQGNDTVYAISSIGYGDRSSMAGQAVALNKTRLNFTITKRDLEKSIDGEGGDVIGSGLIPVFSSALASNYALFMQSKIDLGSGSTTIIGPVGTNSGPVKLNYSSDIIATDGGTGVIYLGPDAEVKYPQSRSIDFDRVYFENELEIPSVPDLPQAPTLPAEPEIPRNSEIEWVKNPLNGGVVEVGPGEVMGFERISLGWNAVLTFSLNGDAVVVVDRLESSGEIKIEGEGELLLVIRDGLDKNSRTLLNTDGDSEQLTIYYPGDEVMFSSNTAISGTIYAPNASLTSKYPSELTGDIIVGGDKFSFDGFSHNGTLYATNKNAAITYSGNRALQPGVVTNIYSAGKKLELSTDHLAGDIYLSNRNAELHISGSSTLKGDIITAGKKTMINGNVSVDGHIVSDNPNSEIYIQRGAKYSGGIVSKGKKVIMSGNGRLNRSLIFAPYAEVELQGGSHVIGGIIGNSFASSSGELRYEEIQFDDLPVYIEPIEEESSEKSNWRVYGEWVKG